MKLVNTAALTMLFALFVVGTYIACGGGARDLVQPTSVQSPPALPDPVAPPMVEPVPVCRGIDLKPHTKFRTDGRNVTVTVTNPYDHTCGDVAAAVYHQIKGVSDQVMFGNYTTKNLSAKQTVVMVFPIPCDPWQADAVLGNWMPSTPIFSPGYFLGYTTGNGYGCPTPKPTPKPTPTPCVDRVTYTGKFVVKSLSNTGNGYQITKNGTLDKIVDLRAGTNVGSWDYPVDGARICLRWPPENNTIGCATASCGPNASWQGTVGFVCEEQHSCPQ